MRAKEFLSEKTLSPTSFYKLPNLQAFIHRLTTSGEFIDDKTHKTIIIKPSKQEIEHLEKVVSEFPANGTLLKSKMKNLIPNSIGGVKLSTLFREFEFGGKGGVKGSNIDTTNITKVGNIGPALEAWKAIGIFSRLIKRTNDPVTLDEMMALKDELLQSMNLTAKSKSSTETAVSRKQISVPDLVGKVADTISVKIDIPLGSFQRAVAASPQDKELWGRIQGINSFINNSKALSRYTMVFAKNGRIDPIKIEVVGGEGGKTDVKTSYLDPAHDYKDKKVITSLSFSLKATSPKMGQSPGTTVDGVRTMFKTLGLDDSHALEAIKSALYAGKSSGSDEPDQIISSRYRALTTIFSMAGQQLERKFAANNNKTEVNFLKHFFETLTHTMTGGDNMTFIDFNVDGTYKQLNPTTIKNLADVVDLEAKVTTGKGSKGRPYLFVYDKNSGRNIMHVRLEVQTGGRLTLHYEQDELLNLAIEANKKVSTLQKLSANPIQTPKAKSGEPMGLPVPQQPPVTTPQPNPI